MFEKQKGFPLLPQVTTVGDNVLTGNNTFSGNNEFSGDVTYGSSSTVTVNGTLQDGNGNEFLTEGEIDTTIPNDPSDEKVPSTALLADSISALTPTNESYTISAWTALADSSPFTYQATVTAAYTIGNDTVVELINDQAVLFATYGFAIGVVSGQNITIYSIGEPSSNVTLGVSFLG